MKNISLFFFALLLSSASFAIAPITGPDSLCVGSTVTLSDATTGGTWTSSNTTASVRSSSGMVTGLVAGVDTIRYTVAATGSITTVIYPITVNPLPAAISGSSTGSVICAGATLTLTDATSGGTWSSGNNAVATAGSSSGTITGVSLGTATITYTLPTGCSVSTVVIVHASPTGITGPSTICTGHSITLSDATTGGTWSSGNASVATAGSGSGIIYGVSAGTAIISYTLSTGCSATFPVTVDPAPCVSGVAATTYTAGVTIFPNPVSDELTIQMNDLEFSSFTITNSIGQVLMQQQLNSAQSKADVKALPSSAIYYIVFRGKNGSIVQRFVKM